MFQNPHAGMMQMQQQQQVPQQLPNNMVAMPNGQILTFEQYNNYVAQMQQQMQLAQQQQMRQQLNPMMMNMQNGYPMQQGMPIANNRFGVMPPNTLGGISAQQMPNVGYGNDTASDRYANPNVVMQPMSVEPERVTEKGPSEYTVNITPQTLTNPSTIAVLPSRSIDIAIVTDSIEEVIEACVDKLFQNESKYKIGVTAQGILETKFYRSDLNTTLIEYLSQKSCRLLYRSLKTAKESTKNKIDKTAISKLNRDLTNYINDYLVTSTTIGATIDSFMDDFNDLLKLFRRKDINALNIEEDNLIYAIDKTLGIIHSNLIQSVERISDDEKGSYPVYTVIPNNIVATYIDLTSEDLGLTNIPRDLLMVGDTAANALLIELGKKLFIESDFEIMHISTADRILFKLIQASNGTLWIGQR